MATNEQSGSPEIDVQSAINQLRREFELRRGMAVVADALAAIGDLQLYKKEYQDRVRPFKQEESDLHARLEGLRSDMADLAQKKSTLTAEVSGLDEKKRELDAVQKQHNEVSAKIVEAEASLKELNAKLTTKLEALRNL